MIGGLQEKYLDSDEFILLIFIKKVNNAEGGC